MLLPQALSGEFVPPCVPPLAAKQPAGPDWVREIKHDGYRLIVRRDGKVVKTLIRGEFPSTPPSGPGTSKWSRNSPKSCNGSCLRRKKKKPTKINSQTTELRGWRRLRRPTARVSRNDRAAGPGLRVPGLCRCARAAAGLPVAAAGFPALGFCPGVARNHPGCGPPRDSDPPSRATFRRKNREPVPLD
jgi:hypothetical protein